MPTKTLLFGREPAVIVGAIEAFLALALTTNWIPGDVLDHEKIGLIMAVVTAVFGVVTAYLTRDTLLGYGVGLIKAAAALAVGYGLHITADQTGALIAFATVTAALWHRTQTSPDPDPSLRLTPVERGPGTVITGL